MKSWVVCARRALARIWSYSNEEENDNRYGARLTSHKSEDMLVGGLYTESGKILCHTQSRHVLNSRSIEPWLDQWGGGYNYLLLIVFPNHVWRVFFITSSVCQTTTWKFNQKCSGSNTWLHIWASLESMVLMFQSVYQCTLVFFSGECELHDKYL